MYTYICIYLSSSSYVIRRFPTCGFEFDVPVGLIMNVSARIPLPKPVWQSIAGANPNPPKPLLNKMFECHYHGI